MTDILFHHAHVIIPKTDKHNYSLFSRTIMTPVPDKNFFVELAEASFEGAGGRRPPPKEKEKKKKRKKKRRKKKREKREKRKMGTMNNVKLLHMQVPH